MPFKLCKLSLYKSLGQKKYYSFLKYADAVVGNSSSGIYETPSFNIPTINIGERQKGRTLDIVENTEKIMEPLSDLVGAEIQLKVDEFTPMQVDVERERNIGQMIIDAPLVISVEYPTEFDGPAWVVDQASLIDMLEFRRDKEVNSNQYNS